MIVLLLLVIHCVRVLIAVCVFNVERKCESKMEEDSRKRESETRFADSSRRSIGPNDGRRRTANAPVVGDDTTRALDKHALATATPFTGRRLAPSSPAASNDATSAIGGVNEHPLSALVIVCVYVFYSTTSLFCEFFLSSSFIHNCFVSCELSHPLRCCERCLPSFSRNEQIYSSMYMLTV